MQKNLNVQHNISEKVKYVKGPVIVKMYKSLNLVFFFSYKHQTVKFYSSLYSEALIIFHPHGFINI